MDGTDRALALQERLHRMDSDELGAMLLLICLETSRRTGGWDSVATLVTSAVEADDDHIFARVTEMLR